MTIQSLRDDLAARGIRLGIAEGDLRIDAPKGMVTLELRQTLADHKSELIAAIKTGWADSAKRLIADCPDAATREHLREFYDGAVGAATTIGGMDRADAERDSFGRLLAHLLECQISAQDDAQPVTEQLDPLEQHLRHVPLPTDTPRPSWGGRITRQERVSKIVSSTKSILGECEQLGAPQESQTQIAKAVELLEPWEAEGRAAS